MVNASEVPSSYTTQWSTDARQKTMRKLCLDNSSQARGSASVQCESCQKAKAKCSGGSPCDRCAGLQGYTQCVYKQNQRSKKRKASQADITWDEFTAQQFTSPPSTHFTATSDHFSMASLIRSSPDLNDTICFNTKPLGKDGNVYQDTNIAPISTHHLELDESCAILPDHHESGSLINALLTPISPSTIPSAMVDTVSDAGQSVLSPCNCQTLNLKLYDQLDAATRHSLTLDKVLLLMQKVSQHAFSYIACSRCDTSSLRLISLAMIHQRQVTLMARIARAPSKYLGHRGSPEAVNFMLGSFQLSTEDELDHKRLAILSAAKKTRTLIAAFDDSVRGHQDMQIIGEVEVSELERINFRWLIEVARSLKTQLNTSILELEKIDWGSEVAQSS